VDIDKILDLVAFGARIAIDALVLAAPVQVHVVLQPKVGIGLFDVVENRFRVNFLNHR
jgi:hypothetical protein